MLHHRSVFYKIMIVPDFRSAGGLYDTLQPDLITATQSQRQLMKADPTYVVERGMFFENSFPYLEVRRPFILGTRDKKWKATIAHRFAELLHKKTNKLQRVYTQNIDGLDRQCDIPSDKIISVHGTLSRASCESCGTEVDFDEFCNALQGSIKDIYNIDSSAPSESKPIQCKTCGKATVKPDTVLFGSNLPKDFFTKSEIDLPSADLLIVAGTSLVVSPANSLVYRVNDKCIRAVFNNEEVGTELGIDYGKDSKRDYACLGNCDEIFFNLIQELGWLGELKKLSSDLPPESVKLLA